MLVGFVLDVPGSAPQRGRWRILGHKRIETTMRYAHFAPDAGRRAIDGLAAALSTKTAPAAGAKVGAAT